MGSSRKAFIGAAALGIAALGTAGVVYHVDNNVLPERIAASMNDQFDRQYNAQSDSALVTVTKDGAITVTRNGFFDYSANIPEITIAPEEALNLGLQGNTTIAASSYDLSVTEHKFTAGLFDEEGAFAPYTNTDVAFTMNSNAPLTIEKTFVEPNSQDTINVNIVCESASNIGSTFEGALDEVDASAENCRINASFVTGYNGAEAFSFTANGSFSVKDALGDDGMHSGDFDLALSDLVFTTDQITGSSASLNIEALATSFAYAGAGEVSVQADEATEAANIFTLEDMTASFSIENANVQVPGIMPESPDLSFSVSTDMQGLTGNEASFNIGYTYSLDNIERLGVFSMFEAPTASSCQAGAENIPAQKLGEIGQNPVTVMEQIEIMEGVFMTRMYVGPDQAAMKAAMIEAGTTMNFNCAVSHDGLFDVQIQGDHHVAEGEVLPGSGTLSIKGIDHLAGNAMMMYGEQVLDVIAPLVDFAELGEDGETLRWNYDLQPNGEMTVNGKTPDQVFPAPSPF